MTEDIQTDILTEFFAGGWRVAPFIKTPDGYLGVKAWPNRAASNYVELQGLVNEQQAKSSKPLVYGIVPSAGRYIIDIDTKKNDQALQLWKDKVFEKYNDLSLANPTLVVKTKSGGFHLYYSDGSDKHLRSPTSIFSKDSGIDIRGYTGMVIAPTALGTAEDWNPGEYVVIKGRPSATLTVLGLSKILGDAYDSADDAIRVLLSQINDALRNDSVSEINRYRLIPDSLVIPSSSRDNTLYRCARLCRLAGLSQDTALLFMNHVATRCETTPEEPLDHWIALAMDKVRRVYASESEMKFQTIAGFYDELDNAGAILLRGVAKSYYYFRHGSKLLRIDPRSKFSTDNIGNVLQGVNIHADDGTIAVKKVVGGYSPKDVAYNTAMYPKKDMPYFEYDGLKYVNTFHDPFATFEPDQTMLERAMPFVQTFDQFIKHITGHEDGDDIHLLNKLAWILQKPYRRLPTATVIYSRTKGSGKDTLGLLLRELVGHKYYMPITLDSIQSEHVLLHDKIVCVASEVQLETNARGSIAAGQFMGKLKDAITAKTTYVNEKFIQAYSAPIFTNFFIFSNFELSAIVEPGDRRLDMFHATEEKLDQSRFGDLADIPNDGKWQERSASDRLFRQHVIYAIRQALMERQIEADFDRVEAKMNSVKAAITEDHSPPSLLWMLHNLPKYFTEDVAMMACYFCPTRITPEYVMKQIKEHFGPKLKPLYRSGRTIHRISGAPKLEKRDDGSGSSVPVMSFDAKASDGSARRAVYYFDLGVRNADPSDTDVKHGIKAWYLQMMKQYSGVTTVLPNQKPDGGTGDII